MILQGSQRGGARNLALHLLKDENEHVEIHEIRGFIAGDLESALKEAQAISKGTRAKQFLFSLSLNPPANEPVTTRQFDDAISRVEDSLGLSDQPRAIVFHEKHGRRHAHAVWSRIDGENMKAIPLPFTSYKLRNISRDLYIEHGWKMPEGYTDSAKCDPKNFNMAEWQQAKRVGKDPRAIKAALQDSWAISDTQGAFQNALAERGFVLARGDRRGVVALDHRCEVFSVSKWVGIKAKNLRAKVTDTKNLPSVEEAKQEIAQSMSKQLGGLEIQQAKVISARLAEIEALRVQLVENHQRIRKQLKSEQYKRAINEVKLRQERYSRGLRGVMDRLTGKHRRIKKQNEQETLRAVLRDQDERDTLIFLQLEERRKLQARIERLKSFHNTRTEQMSADKLAYNDLLQGKRETVDFRKSSKEVRKNAIPEPRL